MSTEHAPPIMMQSILQLIEEYGLLVLFFNVLIEQAGAPAPG